jgi:hypothetical protein
MGCTLASVGGNGDHASDAIFDRIADRDRRPCIIREVGIAVPTSSPMGLAGPGLWRCRPPLCMPFFKRRETSS